jgi:hypothetical protein
MNYDLVYTLTVAGASLWARKNIAALPIAAGSKAVAVKLDAGALLARASGAVGTERMAYV